MTPSHKDLWFVPLGGCGEIGMNLNLYGHAGRWLMVDCGVTFSSERLMPDGRHRVEMPDPVFIENRSGALDGIVATHAHEDHIGAIAHLWERFGCPVYTTPFTRNVLRGKLRRQDAPAPVVTVKSGETQVIGPFRVTWVPITHSTPETHALLIETPAGRVLHTADWKLDSGPVVGDAIDGGRYRELGRTGIDAVVCDSTNATVEGHSASESELFAGLLEAVSSSQGRAVVGCFASNIARLQTLGNVARVAGRHIGLLGRSLTRMVSCARAAGYLAENFNTARPADIGYLPPGETLLIATGSQGEPRAALHRLAMDTHPDVNLAAGDHVVFSAKTIPGNEREVERLTARFRERGVRVTHADEADRPLHASGHPCAGELDRMYRWLRPRLAVPVHGEPRHMRANAELARAAGVPRRLVGANGDLWDLRAGTLRRAAAPVGRLWFDEDDRCLRPVVEAPAGAG